MKRTFHTQQPALSQAQKARLDAVAALPDDPIDYSDAPHLPDAAWVKAAALPDVTKPVGLMLSGGGARAAYQVGVLEAIADLRKECGATAQGNPFPIITGTSAGAINAAALACGSDDFDATVRRMAHTWRNFRAEQVYRADHLSMMRSGATWLTLFSAGWMLAKW
ncbi:MAG: patatin-like phospholipase family protein, partial [Rhodoferax sp.]|nr:patatin-like phospholipase family protein [Rhodoferax sp.]